MRFSSGLWRGWLWLLPLTLSLAAVACVLNPQPIPPGEDDEFGVTDPEGTLGGGSSGGGNSAGGSSGSRGEDDSDDDENPSAWIDGGGDADVERDAGDAGEEPDAGPDGGDENDGGDSGDGGEEPEPEED